MTALQDWLSLRPVDQNAIKEMIFRPLRAVRGGADIAEHPEFTMLAPGIERC